MIKCSKCGAELSDDTKFCSYCGNKINAATPPPTEEDSISFETSHPETAWSNGDKVDTPKSLTDKIKDTVRQAAEHYGLQVSRNGMALCPFHNDRHPSLYVSDDH